MKFLITWQNNANEADEARILALFAAWQPPVTMNEWSGFADGSGGVTIVETDDVDVLVAITAPWTPWLTFTIRAMQPIQSLAGSMAAAATFRGTVH